MFGYIKPYDPYLYKKDDVLYRSFYCGLCKSIKSEFGEVARFTLTYDMSFLSIFLHNYIGKDVEIKKGHCITHVIRKISVAKPDDLSKVCASINILLAWYKIQDDKLDENKGGGKIALFRRAYKKAKRMYPKIDLIIKEGYQSLIALEKANSDSVDITGDCFATMLKNIVREIIGENVTTEVLDLFYGIGKWVYLIDALDDYDKDLKKKNYNVLYNSYKVSSKKELLETKGDDINFIFNGIYMLIRDSFKGIKFKFNSDLVSNIVLMGLPNTTKGIIEKAMR